MKTHYYYIGRLAQICNETARRNHRAFAPRNILKALISSPDDLSIGLGLCNDFRDDLTEENVDKFREIKNQLAKVSAAIPVEVYAIDKAGITREFWSGYYFGKQQFRIWPSLVIWLLLCVGFFSIMQIQSEGFYKYYNRMVRQQNYPMAEGILFLSWNRTKCFSQLHSETLFTPRLLDQSMRYGYKPDVVTVWSWRNKPELMEVYIRNGGNVQIQNEGVPLLFATQSPDVAKQIVAIHPDLLHKVLGDGKNILFHVSSPEIVPWLKEQKVEVKVDTDGIGPLEYRLDQDSSPEIVLSLLKFYWTPETVCKDGSPLFFTKLVRFYPELLQFFLDQKCDIKQVDSQGRTLLHVIGNEEMVPTLLGLGLEINKKDSVGNTPLHYAESSEMREAILKNGADFMAENNAHLTPLEYQLDQPEALETLIGKIRELVEKQSDYDFVTSEMTSERDVYLALLNDKVTLINEYIDLKCDVAKIFQKMIAARRDVLPVFSESKLDLSKLGEEGLTFLQELANKMVEETDAILSDQQQKIQGLPEDKQNEILNQSIEERTKVEKYYQTIFIRLIQNGADINQKNVDGEVLLHRSVMRYLPILTGMALELKADPNIQNANGLTPLHFAAEKNLIQLESYMDMGIVKYRRSYVSDLMTVKMLLSCNADPMILDENGLIPLFYAVNGNNVDVAEAILEKATVVDGKNSMDIEGNDGGTPVFMIRSVEMLDCLKNAHFNIQKKGKNGENATESAISANSLPLLKRLLDEEGLTLNKDEKALNPLVLANSPEMAQFLLDQGISLQYQGKSVLKIICQGYFLQMVLKTINTEETFPQMRAMCELLVKAGCRSEKDVAMAASMKSEDTFREFMRSTFNDEDFTMEKND